jgi:hypothetical protein
MSEENPINLEVKNKPRKTELYIEIGLIFLLGFFVGIAIKNEASRKITIGFDDYKMKIGRQDFSLNKIQDELLNQQAEKNN